MNEPEFGIHPSTALVEMFRAKPFQGQQPELARIIFISSDANYSSRLSQHPFFRHILDYHSNPIKFWRTTGVHHPFLLDSYPFDRRRDGVPFHRKFAAMGLSPHYADKICFLELLDVPTIGIKSKARDDYRALVSEAHMSYIKTLLEDGKPKLFFISSTVLNDLKFLDGRNWAPLNLWRQTPLGRTYGIPLIYKKHDTRMYRVTHFSGSISTEEILAIRKLIESECSHSESQP